MKTILVPIDFSPITPAVVQEAVLLAKVFGGKIRLLTIVQPPVIPNEYGAFPVNVAEIMDANTKGADRQLNHWKQKVKRRGVACETHQVTGAAVTLIIDEAKAVRANYIVVGSHGHTAVFNLLVGSTTHGVLMKSPCPVLIVPAPRGKKPRGKR